MKINLNELPRHNKIPQDYHPFHPDNTTSVCLCDEEGSQIIPAKWIELTHDEVLEIINALLYRNDNVVEAKRLMLIDIKYCDEEQWKKDQMVACVEKHSERLEFPRVEQSETWRSFTCADDVNCMEMKDYLRMFRELVANAEYTPPTPPVVVQTINSIGYAYIPPKQVAVVN